MPAPQWKNSRMSAPPWKSGPSGPRKSPEITAGFSPGGRFPWADCIFPQPLDPCRPESINTRGEWATLTGKYNAGLSLNIDRNNRGCATSRGGRPRFGFGFLSNHTKWVPRPCVPCKGGTRCRRYDMGSSTFQLPPFAKCSRWIGMHCAVCHRKADQPPIKHLKPAETVATE